MSRSRHVQIVAKIAGMIGAAVFAAVVPLISPVVPGAQADTICIPPQHNDPWIGCTN
jgi:hypothetical protein